MQGHWLLASLGKRVLRPGGLELTSWLIDASAIAGRHTVEIAPGLGRTAELLLERRPKSYVGVDADADAIDALRRVVGGRGTVVEADAANTGRETASADVVVSEAILTMQSPDRKREIVGEVARILRPGGTYSIHELALRPDTVDESVKRDITRALARAIRVNARPLTVSEWTDLLNDAGLDVEQTKQAEMALLRPRRLIADEGLRGALTFVGNVLRRPDARRRVLQMRAAFDRHADALCAVAIVARKPE
jgi:SAM-dependent methyltransferase